MKILIILLLIPLTLASNQTDYKEIAEEIYYSLQQKTNLNLYLIKEGSIAPEIIYNENKTSSYNISYWKNKTKTAKKKSYPFGMLIYYLSKNKQKQLALIEVKTAAEEIFNTTFPKRETRITHHSTLNPKNLFFILLTAILIYFILKY